MQQQRQSEQTQQQLIVTRDVLVCDQPTQVQLGDCNDPLPSEAQPEPGICDGRMQEEVGFEEIKDEGLSSRVFPFAFPEAPPFIPGGKPKVDCLPNESGSQARARNLIAKHIEEGNDNIDLSFLNLETVPSSLLRPLRSLTKKPTLERAFLSGDVFFSTEPYFRLMLGCNQLKTISPEILNLVHLHLLSLQHNDIQEVPEAIKNLKELQVLDIGGNRLQCLPWGVMKLIENGRLQHIAAHPNPWIELSDIQETDIEQWFCDVVDGLFFVKNRNKASERTSQTEKPDPESKYSESAPILVARGEKRYLDPEGNSLRSRTARKTPTHTESQYTKSLLEVALKGCTNAPDVIEAFEAMSEGKRERPNKRQSFRGSSEAIDNDNASLSDSPDNDDSDFDSDYFTVPDIIMPLLDLAKYSREFGENTCSICGRTFVIPRVEWIEWWDCSPQESYMKSKRKPENPLFPLPFLRKGCSWLCVADDTRHH